MKTREELEAMKDEIAKAENELTIAEKQANCDHEWEEPTMYSERKQISHDIPMSTIYHWERKCGKCEKVEETTDYETKTIRIPQF